MYSTFSYCSKEQFSKIVAADLFIIGFITFLKEWHIIQSTPAWTNH